MVDQRAEGPRSDIVAADEAQPVDPLVVGEVNGRRCFLHRSGPERVGGLMRTDSVQKSTADQSPRQSRAKSADP
jgi:hypothetical protein